MTRLYVLILAVSALMIPETAAAYVGPGAGLSLLSALWTLLLALFTAFVFVLAYPLRRLMRRRKGDPKAPRRAARYRQADMHSRRA